MQSLSTFYIKIYTIFIFVFTAFAMNSQGQTMTKVTGRVMDAKAKIPMPFVNITFPGTTTGMQTDINGNYSIETDKNVAAIQASFVGYTSDTRKITIGIEQRVDFRLRQESEQLNEVKVTAKREKYRNKNNPAVDLIKKVLEHRDENRRQALPYFSYEKYEKIEFDLNNITQKFRNRKSLRKFDFIFKHTDTSEVNGKPYLPMYLKEIISDVYFRKSPKDQKEIIKAEKKIGFDGYVDEEGLSSYLRTLYQDIDIYQNNIMVLTNQFTSPISPISPQIYKFAIIDTTVYQGVKCVSLGFSARNPTDLAFQGALMVALDSTYAVRKVEMGFNKTVNINFVNELRIVQEFDTVSGKKLMLSRDEIIVDFNFLKKDNSMGLFGKKTVTFRKYQLDNPIPDETFKGDLAIQKLKEADNRNEAYWDQNRHRELTQSEKGIYQMIDSVKTIPAFKRTMNTVTLLLAGYRPFSWFEVGPVNTFYGFNPIEGFRLRLGGRTNTQFSNKWMFENYFAYGFKDTRLKYFVGATYSLTDRNIYQFPVKSVKVSYQNEVRIPGQELQFIQEDNFLLSFKRGANNKMTYNKVFRIDYLNEFASGFSYSLGFKNLIQERAGELQFNFQDGNDNVVSLRDITTSEFSVNLRYAPNEQFYQGKNYRVPIFNKYPVFQLRYNASVKNLFDSQYSYQQLTARFFKRFYISPVGYTDVAMEGGKLFGHVPYILLIIHRANQSYSYQLESYNMMNFLEFVSDQYAAVNVDHYFNGFFFNKIPLLKKLKWREVITFKALYGSLDKGNMPSSQNGLYKFPVDANGFPITYTLDKGAYMEASVGIANVLKFFRIDLVKRLSYLDHPNIPQGYGIRGRFKFDF